MSHDIMLHIDESLDAQQQQHLRDDLARRFGLEATAHTSNQPHLMFLASDPVKAPPHKLVEAVQEAGFHAQLVDL